MRWHTGAYADAQPLSGNGRRYIRVRIVSGYEVRSTEYSVPHPGPCSTCVLWYWQLVKPKAWAVLGGGSDGQKHNRVVLCSTLVRVMKPSFKDTQIDSNKIQIHYFKVHSGLNLHNPKMIVSPPWSPDGSTSVALDRHPFLYTISQFHNFIFTTIFL